MNEHKDASALGLDEVVRRFADSEQALSEARKNLDALTAAEETQAAAARGLHEASTSTTEFVTAAQALVVQARETQQLAREVLQACAGLIDRIDPDELQNRLARAANAATEGFERIEKLLGDERERDQRIAELEAELARRTGVLYWWQRRKLGIR